MHLSDKLNQHDAGYDAGAWENFSAATGIGQPERKHRTAWWWYGGAGLAMILGLVLWGGKEANRQELLKTTNNIASKQSIPQHITTQPPTAFQQKFDRQNQWNKTCNRLAEKKQGFVLNQPIGRQKTAHATEKDIKRKSIANKAAGGVNTVSQVIAAANKPVEMANVENAAVNPEPMLKDEKADLPEHGKAISPPAIPEISDTAPRQHHVPHNPKERNEPLFTHYSVWMGASGYMLPRRLAPVVTGNDQFTAGLFSQLVLHKALGKNWLMGAGIGQLQTITKWNNSRDTVLPSKTTVYFETHLKMDTSTGRINMQLDSTVKYSGFHQVRQVNNGSMKANWICVPVQAAWQRARGSWVYGVNAGATFCIMRSLNGTYSTDFYHNYTAVKPGFKAICYLTAGGTLGKALSQRISLQFQPVITTDARLSGFGWYLAAGIQHKLITKSTK